MSDTRAFRDCIVLDGMTFYAYHGVTQEERELGQRFVVDLRAETDLKVPSRSDALSDTVSYTDLYQTVKAVVEGERYNLLEALAEAVAQRVLSSFPVSAVWVRVKKPSPPIKDAILKGVAIEVYRERKA